MERAPNDPVKYTAYANRKVLALPGMTSIPQSGISLWSPFLHFFFLLLESFLTSLIWAGDGEGGAPSVVDVAPLPDGDPVGLATAPAVGWAGAVVFAAG